MSMEQTERWEFLGSHTSVEVKDALQQEAKKHNVSMSYLVHTMVAQELRKRGYKEVRVSYPHAEYRKTRKV
jgi:hypothetical protein